MNKHLFFFIVMLVTSFFGYSQAPGIFNYQGIARNSVGNALENKTITLRLTIHDNLSTGPVVYQESRTVTTNPFGLFNVQVGSAGATNVTGSILSVNWATGSKFLQVEIDPAGGTSFVNLGTSQLASVPYALNAYGANPIGNAGGDLSGTFPNPTVSKLLGKPLSTTVPPVNSVLGFDGANWGPVSLPNHWLSNGNHIYNSNSGFVGLGTTTPSSNLHIKGPQEVSLELQGNVPYIRFTDPAGNIEAAIENLNNDLGLSANGSINFFTNNSTSMSIRSSGNVGVGTLNPAAKLQVDGNNELFRLRSIGGLGSFMSFYDGSNYKGFFGNDGNDMELGMPSGNPSGNLNFYTNGNNRLSILNNGIARFNKSDEALRLIGSDSYISFYNGTSYKGFVGATGNDIELGTPNSNINGNIVFYTKGAAQMVVQNDGRVRIGPLGCNIRLGGGSYPPPKFSVFGSLGFKKDYPDYAGEWAIAYNEDRPPPNSPPYNSLKFYYNGGLKAWIDEIDGEWHDISDRRLKENFEKYGSVLNDIKKLEILTYHYITDETKKRTLGLVAQNVQQFFPEIISSGNNDILGIAYGKTGVIAIKAIQEQQVIIEEQQKKIETLEKRLAALESKLR